MAESAAFEAACASLEQSSTLDRLEARGTMRIALKHAGLDPKTVTGSQLAAVLTKLLPAELSSRGIAAPEALCARIASALASVDAGVRTDTPEAIFARLANS